MMYIAIISMFLSSGLVIGATATVCEQKGEAPPCDAPEATSQRIRREIGDLTANEWQKVVDAMWTMKSTTMTEGQAKYGSSFRTSDYFVVKHAVAGLDSRGEQAHMGDWFITFHGAFVLEFENALLSIDPTIGAMPYWDVGRHDAFTAEYFGSAPGTGPNNEVIDGKFARWPITQNFDINSWSGYFKSVEGATQEFTGSSTGYLRGNYPPNTLTTEFVTRYGSSSDWGFAVENQSRCIETSCYDEWMYCVDAQPGDVDFHTGIHKVVGGILLDPNDNSTAIPPIRPLTKHGDLEDPNTSPNDPVFMFAHANVERNLQKWMAAHSSELSVYYGYGGDKNPCYSAPWYTEKCTQEGGQGGVNLGDVISAQFPFSSEDLGLSALDTPGITHAEYLCYVGPTTAPYRYVDWSEDETESETSGGVEPLTSEDVEPLTSGDVKDMYNANASLHVALIILVLWQTVCPIQN